VVAWGWGGVIREGGGEDGGGREEGKAEGGCLSGGLEDAMEVAGDEREEANRLVLALIENESVEVAMEQIDDAVESRRVCVSEGVWTIGIGAGTTKRGCLGRWDTGCMCDWWWLSFTGSGMAGSLDGPVFLCRSVSLW
jgi:hypothetical protein